MSGISEIQILDILKLYTLYHCIHSSNAPQLFTILEKNRFLAIPFPGIDPSLVPLAEAD